MDAGNRVVITTTEPAETNFAVMSVSYALNWCPGEEVLLRFPASTQHPVEQILRVISLLSFGQLDQ